MAAVVARRTLSSASGTDNFLAREYPRGKSETILDHRFSTGKSGRKPAFLLWILSRSNLTSMSCVSALRMSNCAPLTGKDDPLRHGEVRALCPRLSRRHGQAPSGYIPRLSLVLVGAPCAVPCHWCDPRSSILDSRHAKILPIGL